MNRMAQKQNGIDLHYILEIKKISLQADQLDQTAYLLLFKSAANFCSRIRAAFFEETVGKCWYKLGRRYLPYFLTNDDEMSTPFLLFTPLTC